MLQLVLYQGHPPTERLGARPRTQADDRGREDAMKGRHEKRITWPTPTTNGRWTTLLWITGIAKLVAAGIVWAVFSGPWALWIGVALIVWGCIHLGWAGYRMGAPNKNGM
jgi:hypothetical protein